MGQGLRVWNADGSLQFESASVNLTRLVARVFVPKGASGSIQLPPGRPWYVVTANIVAGSAGSAFSPGINIDGNNLLSYSSGASAAAVDVTLTVGVY